MPKREGDIFARLDAAVQAKGGQPTLFRWFLVNHERFGKLLAKAARPDWQSIADELGREGLTMRNGKRVTASYARQAWWRAQRKVGLFATVGAASPVLAPSDCLSNPFEIPSDDEDDFIITAADGSILNPPKPK